MKTHVELFAGVGAVSLATDKLGYTTTVCVENDDFCRRVLAKRIPGAAILGDIKEVTGDQLLRLTANRCTEVGDADRSPPTISLMSGGFP